MSRRCADDAVRDAKAVARTLTTIAIALGSTIVLALAGCEGIAAPGRASDASGPPALESARSR